ncbi:hypothetical protein CAPSP0001_2101 [Capnocytophaga sputigena ATCC 33612]|nr:hypothetical protein CAPSP0001_2101 [Capnocytophaga sputigena ATCC 33612]
MTNNSHKTFAFILLYLSFLATNIQKIITSCIYKSKNKIGFLFYQEAYFIFL